MKLGVFHHIGIACESIEQEMLSYLPLGYTQVGPTFTDPHQGVRGLFLEGEGPRLELVENLPGSTMLNAFLKNGPCMYHTAYWLHGPMTMDQICQELEATIIRDITYSAIFKCSIGFVMLPNEQIVELINVLGPQDP